MAKQKQQEGDTVPMERSREAYPDGPWTADVHPDEVANYAAGGWVKAE